jgi:TP901 family phage tail tape measure protein
MGLNVSGSKSLFWKTGIDNSGLKKGAQESKGILAGLASNITKLDVFAGLAASAGLAFVKASKAAYKFSKVFETAMKEVQTISVAVQNNYEGISDQIISMSKRMPDAATKLAQGLYQIVSAGYDGAKAMEILGVSSKLAVAGVTDTFTVADTLTSILNAYGERAGSAMEISDKLFTVVKLGKVEMSSLAQSLSNVTGLAAQAGLEFDDLMAIIAKGTKTMKPEQMITGVKGILNAIIKGPMTQAEDIVKELGIDFSLTALQANGFAGFMEELMQKTNGSIEALQTLFPNVEGLAGLLAVATDEGGKFSDVLKQIEDSSGATETAFKTMVGTAENQTKILMNILNSKLKVWGDQILSSVNQVAGAINKMFVTTGEGYVNNTEKAIGQSVRLKAEFHDLSAELLMLTAKQIKNNYESERYSNIIQQMNADFAPYLRNLMTEKDSYADIASNLEAAKQNLEDYWRAKRKEAVAYDIQKEMDALNKMNATLQYMIDLRKQGLLVVPDKRFYEQAKNEEEVWANVAREISNNNLQLEGLEDRYRVAAGAIDETDRSVMTIVEDFSKAGDVGAAAGQKIAKGFSGMSGISGFDIQKPAPLNFDETKQSLSEIMSLFGDHIKQLEDLRQAGIDTTAILSSEWSNFSNNVKTEYGKDSETYQAVLNLKKDAELEYLEWQKQQWIKQHEYQNEVLQVGLDSYRQFVTSLIDTDMTGKERREMIWESIKSGFTNLLASMTAKLIENYILNQVIAKAGQTAAVASAVVTSKSIASAWSTAAAFTSLATFGANSIPAMAGITSTNALARTMALGSGLNEGGEVLAGSDRNVDSVPTILTKKEIVINRDSAQKNRSILLGINRDKNFIQKYFIPREMYVNRNSGGEVEPRMKFPTMQSFPSRMEITSKQLDSLLGAVMAQTMNQRNISIPVININSHLDAEKFIIEMDATRNKMVKRGYNPNE